MAEPVLKFGTRTLTLALEVTLAFPLQLLLPRLHSDTISTHSTSSSGSCILSQVFSHPQFWSQDRKGEALPPTSTPSPHRNFRTGSFYFCFLPPSTLLCPRPALQAWPRGGDREFFCPKGTEQSWWGLAGPCAHL